MLQTMLQQQDDYFFAEEDRVWDVLEWVQEHRLELQDHGVKARQGGRLPDSCVELLRTGGLFDLALSTEQGGRGLTSAAQARVLEELGTIDGSLAWCVMIGMDSGIYRGFLPSSVSEEVFPTSGLISAGWIHPQGTAVDLGNGTCQVNGRWQFGSGIDHADVLLGGVRYFAHDSSEWTWRIAVLDKQSVKVEQTWDTWGLQGSGSQHYSAEGLIIPTERTFSLHEPKLDGPMHRPHDAILRKMAGIPLGVAVGGLSAVVAGVQKKVAALLKEGEKPNDRVLHSIGNLTADLLSLRASVYSSLATAWDVYQQNPHTQADQDSILVASAAIRQRAFQGSRDLVMKAGDLLGAQAVYVSAGDLGARLSDLHVMCQHAVAQQSLLELAGNRILGGKTAGPFL
ncbi:alkylation response protein AidB-like acyl-CoA dehydrogenase [Arthrobacter sp. JUb119]|uniref:acyl-CoA dehydrogenase family protein n=1 Tax=Arthrobacter sp. JUb115 TaxID=2485108 RepID=UPI00105BDD8B|nr:acyl-CoA dehydrogenase family protein [Arthrobacter sp. JUb115]MCS3494494.1 alkylation response protein AidB-like acyl-CoA dehydrogenase [Arthrobacter sp. JUb119]TDU22584.1 alkylation response protein AidB-like acyl-CoA dehydrogenase [Arthrobacter sp. JUb115]